MKEIMEAIEELLSTLGKGHRRVEKKWGGTLIRVYRIGLNSPTKKMIRIDMIYEEDK